MRPRGAARSSTGLLANGLIATVALAPLIAALVGFLAANSNDDRTQSASRMETFWQALPSSVVTAIVVGACALALVLVLSPAAFLARTSGEFRKGALIVGACLPQIILVLAGASISPWVGSTSTFWLIHVLAVLPITSLIAIYAIERDFGRATWVARTQGLEAPRRGALFLRVLEGRALVLWTFAASAAFQSYLINLCLRARPSEDALVAMAALSPHTGLDWKAVLSACLILLAVQLTIGAMVSALLTRQGGLSAYTRK